MAKESLQHTLDRVRAPRVQITYDVEVGDSIEMKEIPFVVGVLGDLSGKPDEPLPKLKDRKFVEIDRDNFDTVLAGMKPRLAFKADNKLTDDDSKIAVELRFKSMEDFHPERVAEQIAPVRKLVEARKNCQTCSINWMETTGWMNCSKRSFQVLIPWKNSAPNRVLKKRMGKKTNKRR